MIGCIATAPSVGRLSSLSPCRSTGGNLDVPSIAGGATIWIPVKVEGGLFALGDLHAAMGNGEPAGCGLECGGVVTGRVWFVSATRLPGVRIESKHEISFIGSDNDNYVVARAKAINAAWQWLTAECEVPGEAALAVSAGLMQLKLGGPAGTNIIASFPLEALRAIGIKPLLHTIPS